MMKRIIYVDFDGVLVDTLKLIKEQIKIKGNSFESCKQLPWGTFLQKCNEIENNFSDIMTLSKKNKVIMTTYVYSDSEKIEKEKYISDQFRGIECITVPYYKEKNEVANPKGNILIDDYSNNVTNWIKSGGIGIHFKGEKSINKLLSNYLQNKKSNEVVL